MDGESLFDVSDDGTFVPFTDILFNALLGFTVMVFIAFSLIKPDQKTGLVDIKADFIIDVNWPDNNPDDIDVYVRDPAGNIIWYHNKEAGLMQLDRDDRGNYRDTLVINGERIQNPLNQETVTLRGHIPGEYIVNIVDFANSSKAPVPVTVEVSKVNPALTMVFNGTYELSGDGDEKMAVRFTLDDAGEVSNVRTDGIVSLVKEVRRPAGAPEPAANGAPAAPASPAAPAAPADAPR